MQENTFKKIQIICHNTKYNRGSKFSSYEIELRNQVMQNDVKVRVTNSKILIEVLLSNNHEIIIRTGITCKKILL